MFELRGNELFNVQTNPKPNFGGSSGCPGQFHATWAIIILAEVATGNTAELEAASAGVTNWFCAPSVVSEQMAF